jgi:hypothetical protein
MIHRRLSRAVILVTAAAAVCLAATPRNSSRIRDRHPNRQLERRAHPRLGHAAARRPVLIAGDGGTPELYNPATGAWAVTGQMNTPRTDSTATLLPDGQVLIAGGTSVTGTFALSSAELYNPATGTWSVTGSMHQGRSGLDGQDASATLLPDGQVLVAGGEDAKFNPRSSAELYNPATDTWSRTGRMTSPREGQPATLLDDGQVLMADGTAELYNPATGKFTPTGTMLSVHGSSVGTLLPDGDVLVTGKGQDFAELYDPATGQWSNASIGLGTCEGIAECRSFSTATLLPTGNVLVAGGLVGLDRKPQTTATAMLHHPDTNTWTSTGSMTTAREGQTATLLSDGQVLMAGGTLFDHPSAGHPGVFMVLSSAELYTP